MPMRNNQAISYLNEHSPQHPLKLVTQPVKIGHTHWIRAMVAKKDNSIFTSGNDGTIREWDIAKGFCKKVFHLSTEQETAETRFITSLCLLPDNKIAAGSADANSYIIDLNTGESLQIIQGHTLGVTCLTTLKDGKFASGSSDKTIQIIDSKAGKVLQRIKGHDSYISSLCTLPNGDILSSSNDQTIKLWDKDSFEKKKTFKEEHSSTVSTLAIVNENKFVSGSADKTLRLWEISSGKAIQQFEGHTSNVTSIALLTDARIISASRDQTIKLWDVETGACLKTFTGCETWITAVVTLSDNQIVSGGKDQAIRIWTLKSEKCTKIIPKGPPFITDLTVLEEGWILSKDNKGKEQIWNPKNGLVNHKRIQRFSGKQSEHNKVKKTAIANSLVSLHAHSEFIIASIQADSLKKVISACEKKELSNNFLPIIQSYALWLFATLEPYLNPSKRPIFLPIAFRNSIIVPEALILEEKKTPLKLLAKEIVTHLLEWTELFQNIFKGNDRIRSVQAKLEEVRLQLIKIIN
ncbi:MAG: hypothetical protein GF308_18945 [Candidatus Heimdallarchaeota archaeon]|nr:hypothetical protein [Candidatus Heimdallarchaeota archaeon]